MEFLEIEMFQAKNELTFNQHPASKKEIKEEREKKAETLLQALTSTLWEGVAPLSVRLADGLHSPVQNIPGIADKTYNVV